MADNTLVWMQFILVMLAFVFVTVMTGLGEAPWWGIPLVAAIGAATVYGMWRATR